MKKSTSWHHVEKWYDHIVAKKGHTFHQDLIFPSLQSWSLFQKGNALLDLGCGQGVLARHLPKGVDYLGIDAAMALIKKAKSYSDHPFKVGDVTTPYFLDGKTFTHAIFLLSLQNMARGDLAIKCCASHLKPNGKIILVLNHPCFRIPRQSSWGVDEKKKLQYRRLDSYGSSLEIPIAMHPSEQENSPQTLSYHHPLSTYIGWLRESHFLITRLEEWYSNKASVGKKAKMEDRARKEFPLFLALEATLKLE